MAQGQRQRMNPGFARAIMDIGMTDAGGFDAHQHIVRSRIRDGDVLRLQGPAGFNEADSFHEFSQEAASLFLAPGDGDMMRLRNGKFFNLNGYSVMGQK